MTLLVVELPKLYLLLKVGGGGVRGRRNGFCINLKFSSFSFFSGKIPLMLWTNEIKGISGQLF